MVNRFIVRSYSQNIVSQRNKASSTTSFKQWSNIEQQWKNGSIYTKRTLRNTLVSAACLVPKEKVNRYELDRYHSNHHHHRPTNMFRVIVNNGDVSSAGEDACFISDRGNCVGIADGVGTWKKKGFDSSLMSIGLMRHCKSLADAMKTDGYSILNDAFDLLRKEGSVAGGSTTACCITVNRLEDEENADDSKRMLIGLNLGDSGFLVLRPDVGIVYKSAFQWHSFNVPYVLSILPRECDVKRSTVVCNEPAEADIVTMPVQRGDLIIAATDGVWANMHFEELKDMLLNDNMLEKKSVSYISRLICEAAIRKSTDPFVNDSSIPFIKQAERFGLYWSGGQIDDITVVVSRVV